MIKSIQQACRRWSKLLVTGLAILVIVFSLIPIYQNGTVVAQGDPWLSGWNKRIKLTTDCTKIDSDLTHFPITVYLKSGNGETTKVFDEVGSNYLKIAIADDSATPIQYYVEIEQWDSTNNIAVLHFGKSGEVLPSTVNKDFYLYYDNTHADNTDYVGVEGSTPAQNVWETAAIGVWHMNDYPDTSHIKDSTVNANDGTKLGANEPIEAVGKVGNAQDFDGLDDYVDCGKVKDLGETTLTMWFNGGSQPKETDIIDFRPGITKGTFTLNFTGDGRPLLFLHSSNYRYFSDISSYMDGNWHFLALYIKGSDQYDINEATLSIDAENVPPSSTANSQPPLSWTGFAIGGKTYGYYNGLIDEVRIYNRALSAAEIKASYHSLNDSLLTYGNEEILPLTVTADLATNITPFSVTLHGSVSTGGQNVSMRGFDWGILAGNYTWSWNETGSFQEGRFRHVISNLTCCTQYFWRAYTENEAGLSYSTESSFWTSCAPLAPTDFKITQIDSSSINITWVKGIAADTTIIRGSTTDYPSNIFDGDDIYSGNGTYVVVEGLDLTNYAYYYRAWSQNEYEASTDYAQASIDNTLTGALTTLIEGPIGIVNTIFVVGLLGFGFWKKGWLRILFAISVIIWGIFVIPYDIKIAISFIAVSSILFFMGILQLISNYREGIEEVV